ncbi:hypothetical protein SALBM311S_00042 [Streptomyces alboniger]
MESAVARERVLDAAEELFYGRGVQSVGMDDIRNTSGVSLKRLYQLFPAKEQLVEAYLERRDERWRGRLAASVGRVTDPGERILAVFDWLEGWFGEAGFRGCAWINAYGELGASSALVAAQVRTHKRAFGEYLASLVADAGGRPRWPPRSSCSPRAPWSRPGSRGAPGRPPRPGRRPGCCLSPAEVGAQPTVSDTVIAETGQARDASRTIGSPAPSSRPGSRVLRPSSSWVKTPGAARAH